jgi:hypothetical protein
VLTMCDAGQDCPLCRAIALQLGGHHHPRHVLAPFEEPAEELLRSVLLAAALPQEIQAVAVLIHRPPEVVALALDGEKDLIEMPCVTGLRTPIAELMGSRLAEFATPFPNRFVRDADAPSNQQLFDIPVAETDPLVPPDPMADDLGGKAGVLLAVRRSCAHMPSMA